VTVAKSYRDYARTSVAGAPTVLVIAMLSIQLGASMARQILPLVGAPGTTALRTSLAALLMLGLSRPWRHAVSRRLVCAVVLYGLSLGAMNLLFYCALARVPLGIVVALEFTGPLAVSLLGSRRPLDFLWVLLAAVGLLLIVPYGNAAHTVDLTGVGYSLGAGACWGAYILFGQRAGKAGYSGQAAALGMSTAALFVLPFGARAVVAHTGDMHIWLVAFGIAVFSGALPYSLEMVALKRLPARTFGILMSLEPAIAALVGLGFLDEHLSRAQWFAIGCIVIAASGSSMGTKAPPATVS
jgi:inner membrane transporter RhtA